MDLQSSAEVEVRKLQDMVKKLEKQNELLRHTQNGSMNKKRESLDLEEVDLINLNESADDLEESWLYESPVKHATPVQKSVTPFKWMKSVRTDGLDNVRKCLIEKLDDIEAQQEISKVRSLKKSENKRSSLENESLFFQPANRVAKTSNNQQQTRNSQYDRNVEIQSNVNNDKTNIEDDDIEDEYQAPVLRRSVLNQNTVPLSDSSETNTPVTRRSANIAKARYESTEYSGNKDSDSSEEMEDQGPVLPRSSTKSFENVQETADSPVVSRRTPSNVKPRGISSQRNQFMSKSDDSIEDTEEENQGPILRRSTVTPSLSQHSDASAKPSALAETQTIADTSAGTRKIISPVSNGNMRIQPRSRMLANNVRDSGSDDIESGSPNSIDDIDDDDDIDDKGPVMKRSTLVLPKPSSSGLSKQLWYSGPVNQMNPQKTKANPTVARVRRSASPSSDRRSKPKQTAMRRSTGTRGSVEDLLETKEKPSAVQRRSLPQVPTSNGVKSRVSKADESFDNKSQIQSRSKVSNINSPTAVVSRRSIATPHSTTKTANTAAVSRRRAAVPRDEGGSVFDDSWKEGCY